MTRSPNIICLYLCNIANAYSYILHEISMDPRLKEALVSIVHRQVFNNVITCLTSLIVMDIIQITEFCEI